RLEQAAIELRAPPARAVLIQAVLAARDLETLGDQLGVVAGAGHAGAKARIIVAPAAQLMDDAHYVVRAVRIVRREPFLEEILELVRQPHDHVRRFFGARSR